VYSERAERTYSCHGLCSKTRDPPFWRWKLCEFQHGKSISESGINKVTPVAGPIFGPLSTRLIEGFHFEDGLISRFYFVPNPSNLMSQVLPCARSFHTLNRGISFRKIQISLSSVCKRHRENDVYKCSNSGQMFLYY